MRIVKELMEIWLNEVYDICSYTSSISTDHTVESLLQEHIASD